MEKSEQSAIYNPTRNAVHVSDALKTNSMHKARHFVGGDQSVDYIYTNMQLVLYIDLERVKDRVDHEGIWTQIVN